MTPFQLRFLIQNQITHINQLSKSIDNKKEQVKETEILGQQMESAYLEKSESNLKKQIMSSLTDKKNAIANLEALEKEERQQMVLDLQAVSQKIEHQKKTIKTYRRHHVQCMREIISNLDQLE